jgi:phosphotransferase system enzyme I (PtsI)
MIRGTGRSEAKALLERAMEFSTAEEIERYVRAEMQRRFSSAE